MSEKKASWEDLQLFLAVARERGLSPASRITGKSPATLGRRMRALERSLGAELFIRHERGYELTENGHKLLTDLLDVESQIDRTVLKTSEDGIRLVKISAGTWMTVALLDKFDDIVGRPADVKIQFIADERFLDIGRRQAMIGFRNKRPTERNLAGRILRRVEFAPYAAPGAPQKWIKVLANTPSALWLDSKIGDDAVCEVTSPRNSLDLARAGKGTSILPTFIGDNEQGLERIGQTISELGHDQWIVTHQDDRHLPEIRRTIDRLYRVFHRN